MLYTLEITEETNRTVNTVVSSDSEQSAKKQALDIYNETFGDPNIDDPSITAYSHSISIKIVNIGE